MIPKRLRQPFHKVILKTLSTDLLRFSKIAIPCLLLLSLAGYLGKVHWYFELTAHFKVQYLIVLCLCSFVAVWRRSWHWVIIGSLGICINGIALFPCYFPRAEDQTRIDQPHLRLLLSNVNTANRRHTKLIELVEREKPDILVVQEVDDQWTTSLASAGLFPYVEAYPQDDNFGIAILSQMPFHRAESVLLGGTPVQSLYAEIDARGKKLSLLAAHPPPPTHPISFRHRNQQLQAIGAVVQELQGPTIVIGDLNTTMWSPYYRDFVRESGLWDARRGFGVLPTWPTIMPILMIPIDHCLVSPDITVINMRTAKGVGSDHLPIIVDVSL